jgi:hypothetical protein
MNKYRASFLASFGVLFLWGCGGNNTYMATSLNSAGVPGFTVTVYDGPPDTDGNGAGLNPITKSNPSEDLDDEITIVVQSVNGFSGTVALSAGQDNGVTTINPDPSSVNVTSNGFADANIEWDPAEFLAIPRGATKQPTGSNLGSFVVTGSSGSIVESYTVYCDLNARG